ncbi:hypothetical protein [Arthrobacter sp. B2a2-09]|uniref:hypothetical protein n=1 Tax=Arthrobacter sp. B2a2-09 TaxID=2952822 RepID=UPI0022CD232F|nr:hypothetical protein [Arthrobacter sp. B2a2-09]MCZ9882978.1 hypothetical protein [Arthrobacter sp. B2a2-09]
MDQDLSTLTVPLCGRSSEGARHPATPNGSRHRRSILTGVALAGSLSLLTIAAPAHADGGDGLRTGSGKLLGHGTEVQVPVSYRCEEGQNAGVGIILTQATRHGPAVFGGAGSGQRACTGEDEIVTLTIPAGNGHFKPGAASITVSLFTSNPGTPGKAVQVTKNIHLEHEK